MATLLEPIFIRIESEPDREIENTLCYSDCAYFSIDENGITAVFSQDQFSEFSKRMFFNFGRTVFGGINV